MTWTCLICGDVHPIDHEGMFAGSWMICCSCELVARERALGATPPQAERHPTAVNAIVEYMQGEEQDGLIPLVFGLLQAEVIATEERLRPLLALARAAHSAAVDSLGAAQQATRDAWAAQHRSHDLFEAMTVERDALAVRAEAAEAVADVLNVKPDTRCPRCLTRAPNPDGCALCNVKDERDALKAEADVIHADRVRLADEVRELRALRELLLADEDLRDVAKAAEVGDGGLGELLGRIGLGEPVWPCPTASQDVAMVAFVIHRQGLRALALKAALADILASASPNERDHPAMSAAWAKARAALGEVWLMHLWRSKRDGPTRAWCGANPEGGGPMAAPKGYTGVVDEVTCRDCLRAFAERHQGTRLADAAIHRLDALVGDVAKE